MLLCLVCCLTLLTSFFHLSFKNICYNVYGENTEYMYVYTCTSTCMLYGENTEYMYMYVAVLNGLRSEVRDSSIPLCVLGLTI